MPVTLPVGMPDPTASPDGTLVIVSSLPAMTNAQLQYAIEQQITADQVNIKAEALAQADAYGSVAMVLMPGEGVRRWTTAAELASNAWIAAAASAISLLGSATSGQQVVIAQGPNFQMIAFVWTWTV